MQTSQTEDYFGSFEDVEESILLRQKKKIKIIFISSHVPRKCGIATFTKDLNEALLKSGSAIITKIIAMNDTDENYDYCDSVVQIIHQNDFSDYKNAAEYINNSDTDIVCLQHEFGLFGGRNGGYVTKMLTQITKPIVTVLHTVLPNPNISQKKIMSKILALSSRVIVMTEGSTLILKKQFPKNYSKVRIIYHGVPIFEQESTKLYKKKLNITSKNTLLISGLIGPGKGIEYAIHAMPGILAEHPDTQLYIVGQTHPVLKKLHNEEYRESLIKIVEKYNISKNVIFINKYLSLDELIEYYKAVDIFLTPHLDPRQSASGTLSYALGAGKVCISTPFQHAKDVLKNGVGILVPFKNSKEISKSVNHILSDKKYRSQIETKAYEIGKKMQWPQAAQKFINVFDEVLNNEKNSNKTITSYLEKITDDFGVWQHVHGEKIVYSEGYALDDNARGLIVYLQYKKFDKAEICLNYIEKSYNPSKGLTTFFSKNRKPLNYTKVSDAYGQTLFALALCIQNNFQKDRADNLFKKLTKDLGHGVFLRMRCYYLLALTTLGEKKQSKILSEKIIADFDENLNWFEESLTYSNALIPYSLNFYNTKFGKTNSKIENIVLKSYETLEKYMRFNSIPSPVGNKTWQKIGSDTHELNGQQPIDAAFMVIFLSNLYTTFHEKKYLNAMKEWMNWFYGNNTASLSLISKDNKCSDGIDYGHISKNFGAESTIMYLWALYEYRKILK